MHIHNMTPDELGRAVEGASNVATEIARENPAAAALILDAVDLAVRELLVHAVKGDRELAEAIHRRLRAREQN